MGGKHRKENEICLIFLFGRCNFKDLPGFGVPREEEHSLLTKA